ncbi:unnamed protein product [Calypogeia fissa]
MTAALSSLTAYEFSKLQSFWHLTNSSIFDKSLPRLSSFHSTGQVPHQVSLLVPPWSYDSVPRPMMMMMRGRCPWQRQRLGPELCKFHWLPMVLSTKWKTRWIDQQQQQHTRTGQQAALLYLRGNHPSLK